MWGTCRLRFDRIRLFGSYLGRYVLLYIIDMIVIYMIYMIVVIINVYIYI